MVFITQTDIFVYGIPICTIDRHFIGCFLHQKKPANMLTVNVSDIKLLLKNHSAKS